jgi:hypothetical protein
VCERERVCVREKASACVSERECVCVCVCVYERERDARFRRNVGFDACTSTA